MFALPIIASLALLPFVVAQETVESIEAHFTQSHIVPDYFKTFQPTALLSLNYAGTGVVNPGQQLTVAQVGTAPTVTVSAANSTAPINGTFTLAMIDLDIVGANISMGVTRHWLVNGVQVGSDGTVTNSSATAITPYAGPFPASGSGPHRYVVVLYDQPPTFAPPAGFTTTLPVAAYDFLGYVTDSKLGPLVAATYINVEQGTATVSLVATSPVVSSTLATQPTATGKTTSVTGSAPPSSNTSSALQLVFSPVAALFAGLIVMIL